MAVTSPVATITRAAWMADYWLAITKRTWKGSAVSSFVMPLLYVVALGVMLGGFVHSTPAKLEGAGSYLEFVVPGLVASQAMQTMFGEMTYPILGRIQWDKTYFSMMATPLGVGEIVLATLAYAVFRVAIVCGVFFVVMAPFGVFHSVWGVFVAFLAQLLIGLAFATPLFAISCGMKTDSGFSLLFRLAMTPLFLFSGAFFPISNLSDWMEVVAKVTPLWQGVDLTRMLVLGHIDGSRLVVHLVYLVALAALGWWLSVVRLRKRMVA